MHEGFSVNFPDYTCISLTNLKLMSAFHSRNAFSLQVGEI